MVTISSCNCHFPPPSGFQETYQRFSQSQLTHLSYSESQTKDITIYTEEGDRVTISTNQEDRNEYLTYAGITRERLTGSFGGCSFARERVISLEREAFYSENTRTISISVDGNLNEQELKAIKKALKDIDKVMTDFLYDGDLGRAAVRGMEIKKLDTISGLEACYGYERSVMLEQTVQKETTAYSRYQGAETPPLSNTNHLIDQLTRIIQKSGLEPSSFKDPLKDLFSSYRNDLYGNDANDHRKIHMTDLLETQLMKGIENLSNVF